MNKNLYQNCNFSELPAHIFSIANQAYNRKKNQCIILSGESGSGKTFTAKLALEFLANSTNDFDSCLFKQIINGLSILEGIFDFLNLNF